VCSGQGARMNMLVRVPAVRQPNGVHDDANAAHQALLGAATTSHNGLDLGIIEVIRWPMT
jgi:hypothetical protein